MSRKCLPCLLILLLSSAGLDDAWAAATPDRADDAQAAENNEYLHPAPRRGDRPAREELRQPAGPTNRPGAARVDAPRRRQAVPPVPPGAPPLYVLMSLQR